MEREIKRGITEIGRGIKVETSAIMPAFQVLLLVLVAAVIASGAPTSQTSNLLVLYSNGGYNIIVKDLATGDIVKKFTVVEKNPKSVVMDYDRDELFYTDGKTVYQIYLVDQLGVRKASGKGELFTNPVADHIEMAFYKLPSLRTAKQLVYDKGDGFLYLICPYYKNLGDYYLKIDSKDAKVVSSGRIQFTASQYLLHDSMLYASSNHEDTKSTCSHITSITMARLNTERSWKWLEKTGCWSMDALFSLDPLTHRIFYVQNKHTIRVLDGDVRSNQIASMKDCYVISDSEVANEINAMTAYGNVVVWNSKCLKKLYVGFVNRNTSFMSKQTVRVMDTDHEDFNNIIIFKSDVDNNTEMQMDELV